MNKKFIISTNEFSIMQLEDYSLLAVKDEYSDNYLMIQKAYKFDEQDIKLGMDAYHIEINGQENSKYRGVKKISRDVNCIVITLDEQLSSFLGNEELVINFRNEIDSNNFYDELNKIIHGSTL